MPEVPNRTWVFRVNLADTRSAGEPRVRAVPVALKKSELYSSLWSSCDELRGGMDASQYKDYVLTLLFMKYVSDKYAGRPDRSSRSPKAAASPTW